MMPFELLTRKEFVALCATRLFLSVYQTGYVHPDEFFQSTEITAGDLLSIKVKRTWEFDEEKPLRSISFPYMFGGISYLAMKTYNFNLNSWLVLILPRIWMAIISFINDYLIFKMSASQQQQPKYACNIMFASSFVAFVFSPRTFSNSIEMLFMTTLLYLVIDDIKKQKNNVKLHDKIKIKRRYKNEKLIPVIVAAGIFNRPTFLIFCIVPSAIWVINNSSSSTTDMLKTIKRGIISMSIPFLMTCLLFAIIDSFYYNHISYSSIQKVLCNPSLFAESFVNITWTPINFIQYNLDSSNLALHGMHPRYLHILVNVPVLFGINGIFAYFIGIKEIFLYISSYIRGLKVDSSKFMISLSFFIPLIILSVFPHQEMRFLIPLITPVLLITSSVIYSNRILFVISSLHTILGFTVFGMLHQGGLTPCMLKLQSHLQKLPNLHSKVIFYQTYMPPQHLLLLPKNSDVEVLDFSGSPQKSFINYLENTVLRNDSFNNFIILPYTVLQEIREATNFKFAVINSFFPHLSTENLPPISILTPKIMKEYTEVLSWLRNYSSLVKENFSLLLVILQKDSTDYL